ncbi:hypothetical protein BKP45_05880 [Anaerobacillus alkalidiazotrophicus]|uniref:SMODS and SLOG-associating 2TM effector domain-containing protein n=1 Tax=Anaerobacillus alkalidiazotrophicus TaxID=472963 RepID=A0A1S2MEA7_9BACI|nr:DUF2663 family protein [Anaerobacillus alkalidiazotrophicus]OIJ22197.1 hypothetical protein BKP45_05880 [Anaerobacillus alkalidiazotrophicus]
MKKPWDTVNDQAMKMIIRELIKVHGEYQTAKKNTMRWLLASYVPLLALVYIFYTQVQFNLHNIFSTIMSNNTILILLLIYIALAAKVKISMDTEKEAKKDYKDIRGQVTDNLNNIWRMNYDIATCNDIVEALDKQYKINISYKG